MNKAQLISMAKTVQASLTRHSPEILTGVGIAGMITTTIMAVKETPKAIKLLEEAEKQKGEKLEAAEVVKTAWKCYIPAAITGVTSIICLIGSTTVSARRSAALATAYNISQTALTEYRDKVAETFGEKKEEIIRDAIAKDKMEKDPVTKREVVVTGSSPTLCYDGMFGRYFMSDLETIRRAINKVNRDIVSNMYVSLNEFYNEIGLDSVGIGDDIGWRYDDGEIDFFTSAQIAADGRPCTVIMYSVEPKYDFNRIV